MKDTNIVNHDWGKEIIWADYKTHGCKIMLFEKQGAKTPFYFNKTVEKTWFVNSGIFNIKWVDTKDGKMYQQELKEGSVFHVETLKPCSLECKSANGSITEANSGSVDNDVYITLDKAHF
jgi:hypothetical protein